jgi:hypothetical protein
MKIKLTDEYETILTANQESNTIKIIIAQKDTGGIFYANLEQINFLIKGLEIIKNQLKNLDECD